MKSGTNGFYYADEILGITPQGQTAEYKVPASLCKVAAIEKAQSATAATAKIK